MKKLLLFTILLLALATFSKGQDTLTIILSGDFPKGNYGITYNGRMIFYEKLEGYNNYIIKLKRDSIQDPLLRIAVAVRYPLRKGVEVISGVTNDECKSYLQIYIDYQKKKKYLLSYIWRRRLPEDSWYHGKIYDKKFPDPPAFETN